MAIAPYPLLAALLLRGNPARATGGGGIAPPPCFTLSTCQITYPRALRTCHAARLVAVSLRCGWYLWPCGVSRPADGLNTAAVGLICWPCWCFPSSRRYIRPVSASGRRPYQRTTPTPQRPAARPCQPWRLAYTGGRPCFPCPPV